MLQFIGKKRGGKKKTKNLTCIRTHQRTQKTIQYSLIKIKINQIIAIPYFFMYSLYFCYIAALFK